uniref:Fucosyltransferase n=2 Tax=Meloidogyne TaxID=189290 RepID=A0A6V7U532_MELEN|nr:unnamed protein product [Meloidogyne enterolobii]
MPPILIWNRCKHARGIGYPDYPLIESNTKCPFDCTFTYDRKFEANASTTLFFLHLFCNETDWPKNRREDQNYMMYTVESPIQTTFKYYDRKLLTDKFFNSSATYRLDSSVFMPYDALTRITPTTPKENIWDQKEVMERVRKKTKFVFQAVSHCNSESGRDPISRKLKNLTGFDIVGGCFGGWCSYNCYDRNMEDHKFYLALESNICLNYVTEKFWNALRSLTIPVVFSRSVFEGMDVPSNAFIALDDFKSVNEFVEHLKALQNDTERYLKHFEWTKTYTNRKFGYDYSPICQICEYATRQFEQDTKNILDLDKFWNVKDCNRFDVEKFLKD